MYKNYTKTYNNIQSRNFGQKKSHLRRWLKRSGRDSNPRPPAWQAGILTKLNYQTEISRLYIIVCFCIVFIHLQRNEIYILYTILCNSIQLFWYNCDTIFFIFQELGLKSWYKYSNFDTICNYFIRVVSYLYQNKCILMYNIIYYIYISFLCKCT